MHKESNNKIITWKKLTIWEKTDKNPALEEFCAFTWYNYIGNLSFRAGHTLLSNTKWSELKCLIFSPKGYINTPNSNSLPLSLIKEAEIQSN